MRVPVWRSCLLFLCTVSAFVALGRAPGAVNLRLRDIETTLTAEGKSGRDKRAALPWPGAGKAV